MFLGLGSGSRPGVHFNTSRMTDSSLLCAKQVALLLNVSARTAARLLRAGEIAGFKVGGKLWRTRQADVDDYITRSLTADDRKEPPCVKDLASERPAA